MSAFRIGDWVTIVSGTCAGLAGRISQRAHPDVRPYLEWVVELDDSRAVDWPHDWCGAHGSELGPYAVPPEARPLSVGALKW